MEEGQVEGEAADAPERVLIACSQVECERRSPWTAFGQFPLFPIGDPPALSKVVTLVASDAQWGQHGDWHRAFGGRAERRGGGEPRARSKSSERAGAAPSTA
ncbi:hypothetical protein T484DRAFT_1894986 [Baffinella frigidus]|nr:hypothetical protein T484DRAFT_1894986 [Cryptophyta sp. CCMP2293]